MVDAHAEEAASGTATDRPPAPDVPEAPAAWRAKVTPPPPAPAWLLLRLGRHQISCVPRPCPPTSGLKGGEHTGSSPVDRGKSDSKMHVLSDANGLTLLVGVSAG